MRALALAALVAATPAHACHRFHVWKYPYPQRCAVAKAQVPEDRSWYVEFVLPDEREIGIEALKKALQQ